MGSILYGTDDFQFKLTSAGPRTRPEELSGASGSGTLFFVVDSYEVALADGENESVNLESLEELLEIDENPECGFYDSMYYGPDPDDILVALWKGEKEHAEALAEHFEDRDPTSVEVYANVVFRLCNDDWAAMLAYLNTHLVAGAPLTLEEVAGFDVDTILRFIPGEDTPQRADGTGVALHFHDTLPDDGLPFLGFCILVHAVTHKLEFLDVEEEPLYQKVLWKKGGVDDEAGDDAEDDGEEG
jgi:hypothetical protein